MDLEKEFSPMIRVSVRVNGVLLKFLLDTGAHFTTINADIAKRMNLVGAGTKKVVGFGGETQEVRVVVVDHFELGKQYLKGILMLKEPGSDAQFKMRGLDGVLGMDILKDFVVTIDCKNKKASLKYAE